MSFRISLEKFLNVGSQSNILCKSVDMTVSHESRDNYDKGCSRPKDTVHENKKEFRIAA